MGKSITILLLTLLLGCNDFIDTWDGYIIKKGDHHSTRSGMFRRLVSLQDGRHLHFKARFTSSCLYEGNDDINKLYGFTDANSLVHDNSVRFGWRHDGSGKIEVFAYWYSDGVRGFHKMGEAVIYVPDDYEIWARNATYYFRFNDIELTTKRSVNSEHGIRTRLFPYFGGNSPAPQDILIHIYEYN